MNKYSYEQVFNASLKYFNNDELAAKVFVDKYALQNSNGEYLELTPTDMHHRLAKEFARIEAKYPNPMSEEEIFNLLDRFKYIVPQGSPMFGIGNEHYVQSLGNCYVVDSPLDSYGGILKTDQELVQLMKRRAGVGVDISNIRPKGARTKNAAKTTDGIGIFMERFSNSCREVAQSGRRGALLQSISIKHPEVETFIDIKKDLKKITGANISVRLTDDFMQAVKSNSDFTLQWPVDSKNPTITKIIKAKDLWNKIIDSSWASAEPGIFFWDNVIRNSPADIYADKYPNFKTQSTNPCGELPLGLDSCRLLVVNLLSFVKNPFTADAKFDFTHYAAVCKKAQRLMDDLIDLEIEKIEKIIKKINSDPEPESVKNVELNLWNQFLNSCKMGRRTGTGITALGDCLAALNIKYGSQKSIDMTEEIYKQLMINTYKSSCIMAGERGAFPIFDPKLENGHEFIARCLSQDKELKQLYKKYGRRNIALLTTAPTGSVSTQTQTTSGIEPAYMLSYTRRKKINPSDKNAKVDFTDDLGDKWQEFTVYHHGLKQWMDITKEIDIEKSPYYQATSNDVDWEASVDIQAVAQKYIDHSISKTCNLPSSATKELVSKVYMRAYDKGCKGFTVYRDGCRSGVLIDKKENNEFRPVGINCSTSPKRPNELQCDIKKVKINGEAWTMFAGLLCGKPYEMFGGLSKYIDIPNKYKTGKIVKNGKINGISTYNLVVGEGEDEMTIKDIANVFENANYGAFTRTISLSLRHGVPVQFIVEQLQKDKHSDITSFSKVIARTLKQYIEDGTVSGSEKKCPQCNTENSLVYQEGCLMCKIGGCGYSKCG
jgi:ribonucleoside-diphosphate reductase alpha chain